MAFCGGSEVKNLPAKAGDRGQISGYGKSPGEELVILMDFQVEEHSFESHLKITNNVLRENKHTE